MSRWVSESIGGWVSRWVGESVGRSGGWSVGDYSVTQSCVNRLQDSDGGEFISFI